MAEHKLAAGVQLIEAIRELGDALGYYSRREHEIPSSSFPPPANDVAWLRDRLQTHPLMVFEVESKTTNAAAHNVTKVFGESGQNKPLFFFHVFMEGKGDAQRIKELRILFGIYNYRAYALAEQDLTDLVCDVLSQHRRLSTELPVCDLIGALKHPAWATVNLDRILAHAEDLGFDERNTAFLASYANLSLDDCHFAARYARYLKKLGETADAPEVLALYDCYNGAQWAYVVHPAVLCSAVSDPNQQEFYDLLVSRIENNCSFEDFAIHLGHGEEYDCWVIDILPPFAAMLVALTRDIEGASKRLCQFNLAACDVFKATEPHVWTLACVWALHISASYESLSKEFEIARQFANKRGGIPSLFLYNPPSRGWVVSEDEGYYAQQQKDRVQVPELSKFLEARGACTMSQDEYSNEAILLAMEFLICDLLPSDWAARLARLLSANIPKNDS